MNIPATENQNLNLCPSVYIIISFLFYADIFLSELWMKTWLSCRITSLQNIYVRGIETDWVIKLRASKHIGTLDKHLIELLNCMFVKYIVTFNENLVELLNYVVYKT